MLSTLREYLDNFYLSISGIWLQSQSDVRELLKNTRGPAQLETTLKNETTIKIDLYKLALKLPRAPFTSNIVINKFIEKQASLIIIAAYEWIKSVLKLKSIIFVKDCPDIIKVFKCLRDACAHKNHFNFKDKRFLPLKWRNKKLTRSNDGEKLFSKWMCPGDIEYLFEDVSIELEKLGIK